MIIRLKPRWPGARAGMSVAGALAAIAVQLSLAADVTRLRVAVAMRADGKLRFSGLARAARASDDTAGFALRMPRTAGLVWFRRACSVVCCRLVGGFPARLRDDCVLILGRPAPRHGEDGPR